MNPEFEDEFQGDESMADLVRDALLQADLEDFTDAAELEIYDPDYYREDEVEELDFSDMLD